MAKELLEKILGEAESAFQRFQNEGKIIVWDEFQGRTSYTIEVKEDFLKRIENRLKLMLDDEEENINFDKILNTEFDFDSCGWQEYYNPYKEIREEGYEYTYLICFVDHTNTHRDYLETIVHSNIEIKSESQMSEILEQQGEEVPGVFGIAWANCYFQQLDDYDEEDLYLLLQDEEEHYKYIYVEK